MTCKLLLISLRYLHPFCHKTAKCFIKFHPLPSFYVTNARFTVLRRLKSTDLLVQVACCHILCAIIEIIGSDDTPYCGGIFKLDINIPERYSCNIV